MLDQNGRKRLERLMLKELRSRQHAISFKRLMVNVGPGYTRNDYHSALWTLVGNGRVTLTRRYRIKLCS